jgi:phage terminase large subunit-like protein
MEMDDKDLHRYAMDPAFFVDRFVRVNELGQPFRLMDHQREFLRLAFAFDDAGLLLWTTLVYGAIKKSGKTFLEALLALWWAYCHEAPNEIIAIANDLEQVQARAFKSMCGLIRYNPALARSAEVLTKQIILSNRTTITAIASEYAGAAGSNHGFTGWDELWAYTSEASHRLWEELTPVPTRRNSVRVVTTCAGWENESELLRALYKQGVGKEEHPDGQGERLHPTLPIFANQDARLLVYWDHEPRMPWQTPSYYAAQRRTLRPGTYLRLHENRWTTSESTFITPELWDPCVDPTLSPPLPTRSVSLFAGVDAGIKHDNAAVVTVYWKEDKLALGPFRIWRPSPSEPLDIEATIEEFVRELHERYDLASVLCDPYQLHRSITTLQAAGLPIAEFPQTTSNTTRMGQGLFDLLQGRNLRLYPSEALRGQALNTIAVETPRGWRIAKEKASKKIDAVVALAMAVTAALDDAPPAGPSAADLQRAEAQVATLTLAVQQCASGENLQALAAAKRDFSEKRRCYVGEHLGCW